jgi:c-di-GMP-binding flagellar brake protein YcgR
MPRIINKRLTPFHTGAPPAETDLRRTYRIPVSLSLQFSGRHRLGKTGTGLLADLSENGCRIHSTHPLKVGTSLALVAELPHPVLITEARVVRVAGQWSGLEFLRVSPAERTRLRHFLWSHISLAMINNQRPLFTLVCNSHPDRKGLKAIS